MSNLSSNNETKVKVDISKKPLKTTEDINDVANKRDEFASANVLDTLNTFLRKYIVWVFCILTLSLIGVRSLYYNSIVKSPLYSLYSFREYDNKFFDDWAKYLNSDKLNAKPLHPYHWWHKTFADYYLKKHPEKLKNIANYSPVKDSLVVPGKILWNEWYHGNQYHQEPLYAYLLAVFIHFHIDEIKAMIILQLLLGVLSGILLFIITRKHFGEVTAVLTGIFYLYCGILMYNEIILLRTSWVVFFTILNVVVIDRAFAHRRPIDFMLSGLCIGLSFLLLSSFSLFLFGILGIITLIERPKPVLLLKNASLLLLGFFIMFSPVIIRNKIVGAPALSIGSTGPVTFICTNIYGTRSISRWVPVAEKDAEIIAHSNGSLKDAIITTLKTYPSFKSYLFVEWEKVKLLWKGVEYPNNENYYFYKKHIPILQILGLNFFFIAPLGSAGLIFSIYRKKRHYAFYLAIFIQVGILLAFYILARLRAPLVILLLPFAAFAIIECIDMLGKKRKIVFIEIGVIAVLISLSLNSYSSDIDDAMQNDGYFYVLYNTHFEKKLNEYATAKKWNDWLEFQGQFMAFEPNYIRIPAKEDEEVPDNHVRIAKLYEGQHEARRKIYTLIGDRENSQKEINTLKAISEFVISSFKDVDISASINVETLCEMPAYYIDHEKYPQALNVLRKIMNAYPNEEKPNALMGEAFFRFLQYDSSESYDIRTLKINPKNILALDNLARIDFYNKKVQNAIELFKIETEIDPTDEGKYLDIATCYISLDKYDSAIFYTRKAIFINPADKRYYANMANIFKTVGETDSVIKYINLAK